jgi:hypothetical protein
MATFKKATKTDAKLRMAITGPSGSGKTYSALSIAAHLGKRIAVIDTEHGSAAKYSDIFDFDTLELDNFHPRHYIEALADAERAGYDVVIIDSLSHAWNGKGGALEIIDKRGGNSFAAWKDVTPLQRDLVEAMIGSRIHVIATMRSKTEYSTEKNDKGKVEPKKIGLAPIQRDNIEYEFDIVGEMDYKNVMKVDKTRCSVMKGEYYPNPGKAVADILKAWLSGEKPPEIAEIERLAPVVYGDEWPAKVTGLCLWASGESVETLERLKPTELQKILKGLQKQTSAQDAAHDVLEAIL